MKSSMTATLQQPNGFCASEQKPKKTYIQPVYTKGEEIFNAVTHIVGGAFGLGALITLICLTIGNPAHLTAVTVFGISIIILYTMSALYHFLPKGAGKAVFRIFDHCTIFLLIAGTYTPYCMIALGGTTLGTGILIAEWVLAVAGITMNAIAMNNKVIKAISMVLYVAMGWFIVVSFKVLITQISFASLWFLIGGGIAYTAGLAFFGFGKKVKYFHSIWHLFDLAGTALQFVSVLLLVI
jgi:hemolysin III